jgi:Zn-dependent metalloprotease
MDPKRRWVLIVACFVFGGCLVQQQQDLTVTEARNTQDVLNPLIRDEALHLLHQNNLSFEGLVVREVEEDDLGFTHIRCDQSFQELPVFKEEMIYHFNEKGELYFTSGERLVEREVNTNPQVNKDQAGETALEEIKKIKIAQDSIPENLKAELGFLREKLGDTSSSLVLVWKIIPQEGDYPQVFVDAQKGTVVYSDSGIRDD